jgi:hypothetical protein
MQRNRIHHLPSLNLLIEDMAAKALEDTKQSSETLEQPTPIIPLETA